MRDVVITNNQGNEPKNKRTGAPDLPVRRTPHEEVCILFVHNKLTPFVRIDRDLLRQRYDVRELYVRGHLAPLRALRREVWACDAVFCWFASAHSLLPALLGRLLGRPVVLVIGGYDTANMPEIGYGHQRGGLKKYVARAAMRLASALIVNSRYTYGEAIQQAGVPGRKLAVVYHGIETGACDRAAEKAADLVITVGNVDRPNLRRKGLEPFVRAAALVPDARFAVIGAWLDDAIERLRAIAPPNVTFAGRVSDDELRRYFAEARVYVQASAHEGFGLALAEAMAASCVPVVTRAGALPEVVGDAGIYAASPAPPDLAAAIKQALSAGPAAGAAARARIAGQFTPRQRAEGLYQVLERCLRSHKEASL